ncbi:MAG: hypothetical protein JJT81_09430, partial [Rubellimicrobium sp.]|nr:hypothetical protein [Rubellimicrobium sp.]
MIAICRAIAAALVVSCLVATAVRAEQMSARLRALLEHVPKALLRDEGGAGPFHFVDHVAAARAVSHAGPVAGDLWRNPEAPLMRALSPSLRNSYGPGRDGGWEAFG